MTDINDLKFTIEPEEDIEIEQFVNSDNKDAIVLSTWFASKGLEWPVVVVLGLEKEVNVRLPDISIQYHSESDVDAMLDNAFTQIVTSFDDSTTKQKFIDVLMPFEQQTLKNLTYVVMTRAREQLILPWLETDKPNTMQNYVSRININKYPINSIFGCCTYSDFVYTHYDVLETALYGLLNQNNLKFINKDFFKDITAFCLFSSG